MADTLPRASGAGLKLTPAVLAALLVLALSFALSVGFVVANGGMDLPVAPGGSASAQAIAAPSGSAAPSAAAPSVVEPSIEPSVESGVEAATATPTVAPTLTLPPATRTPAPSGSPSPSSNRYALLKPCGDAPDCWIYTIRSGDNLVSIARYFGVPLAAVTELNPWTKTTQLVAGQELRLPPPTR